MSFTNEDLKRLKIMSRHKYWEFDNDYDWTFLNALIARLEAAEEIVRHDDETRRSNLTFFEKGLIAAWKKECGK